MKNDKIIIDRMPIEFKMDMKAIAGIRVARGLAKPIQTEISLPEQIRLLRKTEGYKISLEELKVKPKLRP